MSISYKIKDVAERSGFTAATLRYYEEIGLLPEATRTPGGYRLYDDRTLERLAFIARAKQLGCTLEEIADLTIAWAGGQCGPVQDRLRGVVADKLDGARQQVAELTTLTNELRLAAIALERHRPDGPCDERCGCVTGTADAVTATADTVTATADTVTGTADAVTGTADAVTGTADAVTGTADADEAGRPQVVRLGNKPDQSANTVPVACTLTAASIDGRLTEWHDLLSHVSARDSIDNGLRATFAPATPLETLIRLVAAEQDCCRFFDFAITVDTRGLALEVRSSADALPVLHALFGAVA